MCDTGMYFTTVNRAMLTAVGPPIHRFCCCWKVCVYGKPEGAGTGVTLSNTRYPGLGVPIPYDQETGVCGAVSIRGLAPNESYVSHPTESSVAVASIPPNAGILIDGRTRTLWLCQSAGSVHA